jgi:hypothetical protein
MASTAGRLSEKKSSRSSFQKLLLTDRSALLFGRRNARCVEYAFLVLILTTTAFAIFPQGASAASRLRPLSISPAALRFSAQPIGVVGSGQLITLTNPNGTPVAINAIAVSGNYEIEEKACGDAVAPQASCSILVAFRPVCPTGPQSGALVVNSGASTKPQKVPLSGQGAPNTDYNGGQVLIAGGVGNRSVLLDSAELFNPGTCTFAPTGAMTTSRAFHSATFLDPAIVSGPEAGKVLITGGQVDASGTITDSAELYDPASDTFTSTGSMNVARAEHTATLMRSGPLAGEVVIIGGEARGSATDTAEIYDPSCGTFSMAEGAMRVPRSEHSATLISCGDCAQDGDILVTGGYEKNDGVRGDGIPNATAELFDPATEMFSCIGGEGATLPCADVMTSPRWEHSAESLGNGDVLIMGGSDKDNFFVPGSATDTTDIYAPASGTMSPGPLMSVGRNALATAVLSNGLLSNEVLITGGFSTNGRATLATAELFDPETGRLGCIGGKVRARCASSMTSSRAAHEATLLYGGPSAGEVLITGGISFKARKVLNTAEVFDPTAKRFFKLPNMNAARNEHTATEMQTSYIPSGL